MDASSNPYRAAEVVDEPEPGQELDLTQRTPLREFIPVSCGAVGCFVDTLIAGPVSVLVLKLLPSPQLQALAFSLVLLCVPILAMFVGGRIKSRLERADDKTEPVSTDAE